MNSKTIEQRKNEIVAQHGPWISHNIDLGDGVYTIGNMIAGDEIKLRRVMQIITDLARNEFGRLRILDLACLEGLYAVELARHGATIVGIEGREANIAKARFVKDILSLHKLELIHDDVRRLCPQQHGEFDVVLCLGILYHLDIPNVFSFLAQVARVCTGFTIIDTHISLTPDVSREVEGNAYWGKVYPEHPPGATLDEVAADKLASVDNPTSFWFTRPSLFNLLATVRFTSVYECHLPPEPDKPINRPTLIALKGSRVQAASQVTRHGRDQVQSQELGCAVPVHQRRQYPDRQQSDGADAARSGDRKKKLDVPGERRRRSHGGRAVQSCGQRQAASSRSAGVSDRRAAPPAGGHEPIGAARSLARPLGDVPSRARHAIPAR